MAAATRMKSKAKPNPNPAWKPALSAMSPTSHGTIIAPDDIAADSAPVTVPAEEAKSLFAYAKPVG